VAALHTLVEDRSCRGGEVRSYSCTLVGGRSLVEDGGVLQLFSHIHERQITVRSSSGDGGASAALTHL